MNNPLFELGALVATPTALKTLNHLGISASVLLHRHVTGDWGDLNAEDARLNDHTAVHGERILSSYGTDPDKIWVITEADRSVPTILLPENY